MNAFINPSSTIESFMQNFVSKAFESRIFELNNPQDMQKKFMPLLCEEQSIWENIDIKIFKDTKWSFIINTQSHLEPNEIIIGFYFGKDILHVIVGDDIRKFLRGYNEKAYHIVKNIKLSDIISKPKLLYSELIDVFQGSLTFGNRKGFKEKISEIEIV